MNKKNILKTVISLTFIFTSLLACNTDKHENDVYDNYATVDYISGKGVLDFYVSPDDEVYYICHYPYNLNAINLSIRKIDVNGNVIVIQPDNDVLGFNPVIAGSNNENIYFIAHYTTSQNIYEYVTSSSTTNIYPMPYPLFHIEYFRDETYIISDSSKVLRFDPALGTASIIAGSGTSSIVDGIGINASFEYISKIYVKDEIIYVIDGSFDGYIYGNNIRKIEKVGSDFIVSTLVSNYPYSFKDISVNDSGELFVLVREQGKGIYKLNNSDNSLEEYLTGFLNYKNKKNNQNYYYSQDWFSIDGFAIKSDDLYLLNDDQEVIKIPDYERQFNLY